MLPSMRHPFLPEHLKKNMKTNHQIKQKRVMFEILCAELNFNSYREFIADMRKKLYRYRM